MEEKKRLCFTYPALQGFDMHSIQFTSDVEALAYISSKVNEMIDAYNQGIITMRQLQQAVESMETQWDNVKNEFPSQIKDAVDDYFGSDDFRTLLTQQIEGVLDSDFMSGIMSNDWTLILGDSWGDTGRSDDYSQWAKDAVANYPRVKSYCVSGAKVSDVAAQVTSASNDDDFSDYQVTGVMVIVGVNDFNSGTTPNVNSMLTTIRNTFKRARVLILCDCPNPSCGVDATYGHTIQQFNSWYKTNFAMYGVNMANLLPSNAYFVFTDTGYSNASYHLSSMGNTKMSNIFRAFITGQPLNRLPIDNPTTTQQNIVFSKITYASSLVFGEPFTPNGSFTMANKNGLNAPDIDYFVPLNQRFDEVENNLLMLGLLVPQSNINNFNGYYGTDHSLYGSIPAVANTLPLGPQTVDVNLYSAFTQNLGDGQRMATISGEKYYIAYLIGVSCGSTASTTTINVNASPFVSLITNNVY